MTSVTEGNRTTGIDGSSLEVDWFRDTITVVQLMELSRSTRADIDARTNDLISHLRELLAVDLGADQDDDVMKVYRQAYRKLELSNRPMPATSAYDAFAFMDELATITFALLRIYVAKNEAQTQ
ncbi:hypothetical protein [Streptomyces sp. NBC_01092]|uniref:hypothetical protein n=1 Tax=Streptomyces sp. NBC_01092 TaxID=2903748 RepID=UPI00386BDCED|nr:hypothetical protein OG254_42960 [Streptomyces sp. NBC_01092]